MSEPMSAERFRALASAYGARLELWPEQERSAARALAESSAEARGWLEQEAGLDAALSSLDELEPSAALLRRLNEVPLRAPQRRWLWSLRGAWIPALGWAFAAALGLGWGLLDPPLDWGEPAADSAALSVAPVEAGSGDVAPATEDEWSALVRGSLAELEE